MTVAELIRLLQEQDPSAEVDVSVCCATRREKILGVAAAPDGTVIVVAD